MVTVRDLRTGREQVYSCTPRQAVIAAFAQDRGDWNTWDYETRYGHLVENGRWHFFCGDFAARFAEVI